MAILAGHFQFLTNNTGLTNDAHIDHYYCNPDNVVSNNRHFIADTMQEYQPNGDGTTEGQSLECIGHCYAYLATRDKRYLDAAEAYWQAYVDWFYAHQGVPETTQQWICNWLVNSKETTLADWPVDPTEATHGGYKCVPIEFTNGLGRIPQGTPYWGEYVDVVAQAHRGHPTYGAINSNSVKIVDTLDWEEVLAHRVTTMPAAPTEVTSWVDWMAYLGKPMYDIDWATRVDVLPIDWVICWNGAKVSSDDGTIATDQDPDDYGLVQLKDTTINGCYFLNYAVKLPVDKGGYQFKRNEVWHNRPINAPILGGVAAMGNASDAEAWFIDANYLLWKITGKNIYKLALNSNIYTVLRYIQIDRDDKFFRKSAAATTPFTDGISYDFIYPADTTYVYSRTKDGYIRADIDAAAQLSLEQQSVVFTILQDSLVRNTYGGYSPNGHAVNAIARLILDTVRDPDIETAYVAHLPGYSTGLIYTSDVQLKDFVRESKDDGSDYMMADPRAVTDYSGASWLSKYDQNILGRRAAYMAGTLPDDSAGLIIGFWLTATSYSDLTQLVYRASKPVNITIDDANAWTWHWELPAATDWTTVQLNPANLILNDYQGAHPTDPRPAAPADITHLDQFSVVTTNTETEPATFDYYCVNDIPPGYPNETALSLLYRITISCDEQFVGFIGDCYVINPGDPDLEYCPGVIPFGNAYNVGTAQIGAWRGQPFPGYQYGVLYAFWYDKYEKELNNLVDFLYDGQQFYKAQVGVLGPIPGAFTWDRWDNTPYGTPHEFTLYQWGDGTPWSGYQARAYQAGCRIAQELAWRGKPIPQKLVDYINNWIDFIWSFWLEYNEIPMNYHATTPPTPDDVSEHMLGLYLAGTAMADDAGVTNDKVKSYNVQEACITRLFQRYRNTGIAGHSMNGSYSDDPFHGPGDNGMYFGFYGGEIFRGLGMFIMNQHKTQGVSPWPVSDSEINIIVEPDSDAPVAPVVPN